MASEDIGLADPRGLRLALDAAEVYERLGSPEGELALAQAVVYLSVAPKSNATYTAWGAVRAFVREDGTRPVPLHLRNAPTKLMKQLGYGSGYRYAHDEPEGFAAGETYWPDGMAPQRFYEPVDRGLEQRIAERLAAVCGRSTEAIRRRVTPASGYPPPWRENCTPTIAPSLRVPPGPPPGEQAGSMDIFLQQIINGLVLGSVYALVALGYTMVYGIINLINFAHGEVLMVGALTSWTVVTVAGRCWRCRVG